jgi:hypothetical protein
MYRRVKEGTRTPDLRKEYPKAGGSNPLTTTLQRMFGANSRLKSS